jgi:hypothetical protein
VSGDELERYPSLEVFSDEMGASHRVKYMECVREGGVVKFVKHERRVEKGILDALVCELVRKANKYGR